MWKLSAVAALFSPSPPVHATPSHSFSRPMRHFGFPDYLNTHTVKRIFPTHPFPSLSLLFWHIHFTVCCLLLSGMTKIELNRKCCEAVISESTIEKQTRECSGSAAAVGMTQVHRSDAGPQKLIHEHIAAQTQMDVRKQTRQEACTQTRTDERTKMLARTPTQRYTHELVGALKRGRMHALIKTDILEKNE